jgi:putative transposase
VRLRPEHPNHVWSYDFVSTFTHDGRTVRMLNLIDEYTRECLAIHVRRRINSSNLIEVLANAMIEHGIPEYIRSDNGPEFVAKELRKWLARTGTATLYIEPGSPWENGYCESFNSRLRDECMNVEVFFTLTDARRKLALWRHDYNHHRPHSALDDRTPAEFAAVCSDGKVGDKAALENAARLPLFQRTAAAAGMSLTAPISSPLLEVIT